MSFEARLVAAVKLKREREGLSLRALSDVVGVSFSTLARLERGDGTPDNNSKIRLLEWLGAEAEALGLSFENVALVHFRAGKNARSATVRTLLSAADCLRRNLSGPDDDHEDHSGEEDPDPLEQEPVSLSKEELERAAERFRADLGLSEDEPLESLRLDVEGVEVIRLRQTNCLDDVTVRKLSTEACDEWSAMSVPLDSAHERWAVLLNDCHTVERQRVTVLEEIWHILLGHKLTKIAKIAEAYGRTYDKAEEHDAYYLASATLLPRTSVVQAVSRKQTSPQIAQQFGTSPELVDYRIKRLGLWRDHVGKRVALSD
jgi:transcriptional regulator with XRE-family HTH domain